MEPSTKKFIAAGLAVAVVGGIVFYAGTASAKSTGGEPFVLQMIKTVGYKKLAVAIPSMSMVDPDPSSKGPRLLEWVREVQGRGMTVLVPSIYYQGVMSGSPSQLIAVDSASAQLMAPLGIFKILPKV